MKISLDWISDFVDLTGIEPEILADRLTLCTAEVEGVEVLRRAVEGVLIGQVLSVKPVGQQEGGHPEASRLCLAAVDCGGRRFATVCGAPNLRVGMKAPFALPGATLAGGMTVRPSEVSGRPSEGVLCSAMELGLSRWHEGVLECPADLPTGTPLSAYIPATDVLIEIDNKSLTHRPDLWGHYGFARELSAIFARPLRALPVADLALYEDLPAYPLAVEATEDCPCYGCLEFRVPAGLPSPLAIQRRLHALGQRTYNLIVDVTNYVMLELGQPTHAFDGDLVRGIRVAPMGRHGTFTTLDGQQRDLLPEDLLIWNHQEPVALAGVMGGLQSEVRPTTTRVLLESANFKASRIRRTSVRLDLRTDAAQRFEKGQPPANVKLAVGRILRLIQEAGAKPEVLSRFTVAGQLKEGYRPLVFSRHLLRTMAGQDIPDAEVESILGRLGFQARFDAAGQLHVGIPPHRSERDISIPPDVVEEVLRIYGYGRIEPRMPQMRIEPLVVDKSLRMEHKVRRLLAIGHRFVEVHNYGWFDQRWLEQLGFEPERALVLRNPTAQQNRLLRTALLPNLLALVGPNRVHRESFRLFELGRVYALADDGGCLETTRLAGVSFHQAAHPTIEEHFRAVKGVLEDLACVVGCGPLRFEPRPTGTAPWELPHQWAAIRLGDRQVGGLGALSGPILRTVAEHGQVVWFELGLDELDGSLYPQLRYAPPPVYPGSWQDFSLIWEAAQGYAALEARLDRFSHPLLVRREFLYVYHGKGLRPGQGSYTFRYWIGASDHTLSGQEINQFRASLLAFLAQEGIPLRT
ncbi:MAG: phenylalanine--tRNA ligase subunit beta [Thermoguttaceae bacterium]